MHFLIRATAAIRSFMSRCTVPGPEMRPFRAVSEAFFESLVGGRYQPPCSVKELSASVTVMASRSTLGLACT